MGLFAMEPGVWKKMQVVQSTDDHKIFKYEESFYTLQIVKVKKNYKVRGCMQSANVLNATATDLSSALGKARTLLEAWRILGDFLERTLKARKCVRVKELFEDLWALEIDRSSSFSIDGKRILIQVDEKEIEARHRFLIVRGCRLLQVVQEMRKQLQIHGESLNLLDCMKEEFIIREDGDLFYFDGEEKKLEYDLNKKEFMELNCLVRRAQEEDYGCGICFVVYLDNHTPSVRCEECGWGYHESCLREWLEAEGDCEYLSDQIIGKCLYCQHALFCKYYFPPISKVT